MRRRGMGWIRARSAIVGAAGILALASCSLVLEPNTPQCSTTDDCVARGAAFAATTCVDSRCAAKAPVTTLSVDAGPPEAPYDPADPWRCVGHVTWPTPTTEPLVDREVFANFVDGRAVSGLTVEVCARADVGCTSPLATVVTDASGAAALPIAKGFAGYVQMKTPPASFPELLPMIVAYVVPPGLDPTATSQLCVACRASSAVGEAIPVLSKRDATALSAAVSAVLDPSRGLLFARLGDCDGHITPGVQLELEQADEKTTRYYFEDGVPNLTSTWTTETGLAGFVNVRPGLVSLRARLASTGQLIGARTVLVRAGTLSALYFPPTPL